MLPVTRTCQHWHLIVYSACFLGPVWHWKTLLNLPTKPEAQTSKLSSEVEAQVSRALMYLQLKSCRRYSSSGSANHAMFTQDYHDDRQEPHGHHYQWSGGCIGTFRPRCVIP